MSVGDKLSLRVEHSHSKTCEKSDTHTKISTNVQSLYLSWSHWTPTSSLHCILFSVLSQGCYLVFAFASIGPNIQCFLFHDFLQKQKPTKNLFM